MNNLDQLFIRACKSKNPEKRLMSVYNRFYLTDRSVYTDEYKKSVILSKLIDLVDTYAPITVRKIMRDLDQYNSYTVLRAERVNEDMFKILLSHIRLSEMSKFPNMRTPLCSEKVNIHDIQF